MYLLLYLSKKKKYRFDDLLSCSYFCSSVTIQNVQDQSHDLWRYQRFLLVDEFRKRSLLPPPFNTFYCLVSGIGRFITHYQKRYRNHHLSNYFELFKNFLFFSGFSKIVQDENLKIGTNETVDRQLKSNEYSSNQSVILFN
jgi:hypothetical protein